VINYVNGDATQPQGEGPKFLIHVVNDVGLWGAGFVLAVSRRWPQPEAAYKGWHAVRDRLPEVRFELGNVQTVKVGSELSVINMIAQQGVGRRAGGIPLDYVSLKDCLKRVAELAKPLEASTHMPRIGCGLAGGKWSVVEQIIDETLIEAGVPVTVYDFTG